MNINVNKFNILREATQVSNLSGNEEYGFKRIFDNEIRNIENNKYPLPEENNELFICNKEYINSYHYNNLIKNSVFKSRQDEY